MYRRNFRRLNSSVRNRYNNRRKLNCSAFVGMDTEEIEQLIEDNIYEAFQDVTDTEMNVFETFPDVNVYAEVTARGTESFVDVELDINAGEGLDRVQCYTRIAEDYAPVDVFNACTNLVKEAIADIKENMEEVFFDYFDAHSKQAKLVEANVIPGSQYNLWEIDAVVEVAPEQEQAYTVRTAPDRKSVEEAAQSILSWKNF